MRKLKDILESNKEKAKEVDFPKIFTLIEEARFKYLKKLTGNSKDPYSHRVDLTPEEVKLLSQISNSFGRDEFNPLQGCVYLNAEDHVLGVGSADDMQRLVSAAQKYSQQYPAFFRKLEEITQEMIQVEAEIDEYIERITTGNGACICGKNPEDRTFKKYGVDLECSVHGQDAKECTCPDVVDCEGQPLDDDKCPVHGSYAAHDAADYEATERSKHWSHSGI
jgi:hypothetical protein